MKERILSLRKEGKTYNQIREILGCSKSAISYHCGSGQKEKSNRRNRINRATKKRENLPYYLQEKLKITLVRSKLKKLFSNYFLDRKLEFRFSNEDIKKKVLEIVSHPYCYLTGDRIDLNNRASYQFDHIIPVSKGGENTLENIGLTTKEANQSKASLLLDEYIEICKKILEKRNYKITYCQVLEQVDKPSILDGAEYSN